MIVQWNSTNSLIKIQFLIKCENLIPADKDSTTPKWRKEWIFEYAYYLILSFIKKMLHKIFQSRNI